MKVNRDVTFAIVLPLTKVTLKPVQKHLSKNHKVATEGPINNVQIEVEKYEEIEQKNTQEGQL